MVCELLKLLYLKDRVDAKKCLPTPSGTVLNDDKQNITALSIGL
jgi:hypothetical protein